jgi:glucan phosphoethanolaminetransferase (alkaline phosphatase superfamily)
MALQFWGEAALKHGVFALHWAAFYFTLEVFRQLLPRLGGWVTPVSILTTLVAIGYLYLAMRVVYRRGRIGTALRALLSIVAFAALLGAWLWSTTALAEKIA